MRLKHLLSVFLTLLTLGVGNVWADPDYSLNESWDFGTSGNSNWSSINCNSYCGGWGKNKDASPSVYKTNIQNFKDIDFSIHENVSLTIYVKAGTNSGTNSYTVKLIDKDGNQVSTYSSTKTNGMGSGSNASSAKESSVTFSPSTAFTGYRIDFNPKAFITQTRYVLTYDDKAASCSNTPTMSFSPNSVEKTVGDDNFTKAVSISGKGGSQTVAYTSSNTDVATVNSSTGEVTIKNNGSATITASVSESGDYCSASASYTLTVNKPSYTVNWYVGGNLVKTASVTKDETATLPATPADNALGGSCSSLEFMGWSETNIGSTGTTAPADLFTAAPTITSAKNYYAVFATADEGEAVEGWQQCATLDDFVDGDFYLFVSPEYNNTHYYVPAPSGAISQEMYSSTADGNQVASNSNPTSITKAQGAWKLIKSSTSWKIQSSNASTIYLYSGTNNNKLGAAVATTASSTWSITKHASSSTFAFQYNSSRYLCAYNQSPYGFRTYTGTGTNGTAYLTVYHWVSNSGTIYSNYITTCCTPLGSINGSFSFTNVSPTSVTVGVPSDYSDKDNANLTGYIFKRYAAASGGDALETIETNAADKTTATFSTGLVANTTYYYTIIAKHSSSSCNSAETSPRKLYKIDSYVVSYANGGGSGTNPGAHNPVLANETVDLKSNTFDAPTGKEFKAWNDGTSDFDEGETYTVTANKTMTAQWQCMEPGFTKNLSTTQVDYLQGETAAKLSVTAAANGAELSYAWEMSANGTTGWSSVGTNSNEYTPSTATAGHQYYHCIVTNLVDGCTDSKATSAVAHIHVDVPAACLQPVISVASDTYYEDKSVTITCGTDGASIYYTTDGSTTPTSGSTLYTGAITVDHSMTIKAIAIKAGMDNSTVAEATYTIKCETPTIVLAAGNYTGVQTTTITKGYGTKIYYTTDGSTPDNTKTEYTEAVSIDQPMTLKAIVWKEGCTNSDVASAAYTLKCTTPTFNNGTGTYTGVQSITLSGTAGADIYYTLDGTDPSKTHGTKYTAAIEVGTNQTVKAIAVKEGWGDSEIASATYTIQYNVCWWVNGVPWTDKGGSTLVTYGQTATAPTTAPTKANGCGDKFMGWTTIPDYEDDDTAPTGMFTETSAAITGETNFYAVFADYGEDE